MPLRPGVSRRANRRGMHSSPDVTPHHQIAGLLVGQGSVGSTANTSSFPREDFPHDQGKGQRDWSENRLRPA